MSANAQPTQEQVDHFVGAAHGDLARVRDFADAYPGHLEARSRQDETALQAAAHTGQRAIAELLLERGAALDICTAALLGRNADVRRMLDGDAAQARAAGAHGIPVAFYPALGGNLEGLALLAERGADLNAGAGLNTPLHGAAMANRAEVAEWLLAHGARPDAPDYAGKTPLQVAEQLGRAEVAAVLSRTAQPA